MILNVILFSIIIVLTVAVGLWFLIDYKRAKAGKSPFCGNAKPTIKTSAEVSYELYLRRRRTFRGGI